MTAGGPHEEGEALVRRGRPVSAHLAAIAAAVVLVSVVLGAATSMRTWQDGQADVRRDAGALARTVANAVESALAAGQTQVLTLAPNPQVATLLTVTTNDPCDLSFELDPFADSHLDVVRRDGSVACSSVVPTAGNGSHAGAPWLRQLDTVDGLLLTGSFRDGATGASAVGLAVPVVDAAGSVLGAVALVLPTDGIARRLETVFGGPLGFDFALQDASGDVLSISEASLPGVPVDGYLTGVAPVESLDWDVVAVIPTGKALASVRTSLLRSGLVWFGMVVVLLAALVVVNRRIARPLRRLNDAVGHEGPGALEALASVRGPREIELLAEEFEMALGAHADFEAQLSHQALHDPLTDLPNRALLADRLALVLRHAERTGGQIAVVFLDLDHFKLVNDGLGHGMGDLVLVATAERLASAVRASDTVARFGGDEFVVLSEVVDRQDADRLADRLLEAVQAPIQIDEIVVRVTASAGMAIGSGESDGAALVRDADAAMYLAKARGRSRHEAFNEELRDRARSRLTIETELRVALDRSELHVAYQPKVDLFSGAHVGVEALVRWDHPGLGSVSPATFIPVAEETGLMVSIGRFVLDSACSQLATWQQEGIDIHMSVNFSGRQLTDPTFLEHLRLVLDGCGFDPANLVLELTESVLMRNDADTAAVLGAVHDLGVGLSIDDFGTGYSSLAYLDQFPVQELKIDRSFVDKIVLDPRQRSLVTAMIAMGKSLDLRVVAEGVETEEQADLLRALGCDQAQGYLFARPQGAEAIGTLLRQRQPTRS